jgi:hypothetical protein
VTWVALNERHPLPRSVMLGFLALLPRGLTTFLFALAALLRFYGSANTIPFQAVPLTLLGWSLTAFLLASAALLADLGVEWNRRNRDRAGQAQRAFLQDGCLVGLAEFQLESGETSRVRLRTAAQLLRDSLEWMRD